MARVTILYEDSAGTNVKQFGPHSLLVACVADQKRTDFWTVNKRLIAEPKNGVNKLLDALREDMNRYARGGGWVFALIDRDDVHDHLEPKLAPNACRTSIIERIKRCPSADRLDVVLLEKNLETILQSLRELQPELAGPENWNRAISQKDINERDRILNNVALNSARGTLRAELLARVPSFARLVSRVAAFV
jgi:hypothetical protein